MNTLVVWELLCAALVWAVFCRMVFVDKTTKPEVRIVLRATGFAALIGAGAPLYGWMPDGITLLVVGAVVSTEVVLSQYWKYGIPSHFIREMYRPHRRSGDAQ